MNIADYLSQPPNPSNLTSRRISKVDPSTGARTMAVVSTLNRGVLVRPSTYNATTRRTGEPARTATFAYGPNRNRSIRVTAYGDDMKILEDLKPGAVCNILGEVTDSHNLLGETVQVNAFLTLHAIDQVGVDEVVARRFADSLAKQNASDPTGSSAEQNTTPFEVGA